ncbi:MAG: hypothetical protein IJL75_01100, partial [Eubacterium sp.]|nr:hypothetical protein [Eubacterium sp.]
MKRLFARMIAIALVMSCLTLVGGSISVAAQSPRMNLTRLDLTKGTTFTLRVFNLEDGQTIAYKSTDTDIVSIESIAENKRSVVVFGKALGTANVKVTVKKDNQIIAKLKCKIKVAPVPVSIKFTDSTIELLEGRQAYIDVIIKPYSATETPVYESSDENVAVVNVR